MRVRYGKPIKVKSLLGKANIPFSYTAANITFYPLTTGTFNYHAGPGILNIKYVNRQANHKYFLFLNTDIVYSWSYFGIWDTYSTGYEGNRTAPIKDGNNYYALISPTTSVTNGVPSFQFGVTQNLPAIANYALIIDLTEIGLDNLTAQEFYNKYNKYFPLIATGEEITIDDKAGQIPLKKLLPDEYQEVEYVESPDNQYIDTGKTVDSSCVISFDFQYVSITNKYNRIFGARNSNGNALLNMSTTDETGGNFYLESSGSAWADTAVDTNKHSIVMDSVANTMVFDGVKKLSSFRIANNTEGTMWIFGTNQGGSNSNVRFFNYKLAKNGVLEQNLIPCYNKYTGDIGFYDLRGGGKNLCFRPTFSKYDFSKDYLVYNGDNAVYLEAGTYTLSFVSDSGVYIQAWNPNDTSTNVLATAAFSNCSVPSGSVGAVWDDKGLNVESKGPLTFTLTNNYIITICGRVSEENYAVTNIQIEKGTAATAYEHSAFYVNNGTGKFLKGPNVSNVISCKIAGGSSDVYYGYNNLCMPLVQDYFYSEHNTEPTAARTYDESSNSTTYTAGGGNKNFRLLSTDKNILSVVEGHHYYVRAKMSWNCQNAVITKMASLTVLTSPVFNIVDYGKPVTNNAYFENIHISKRTGSARWVWPPVIDSGEVQDGDTFTTSDFEIIDLTDWFGPGNEPATVKEFKEKFAKEYYGTCLTPIKLTRYQIEALPSYGYNQMANRLNSSSDAGFTWAWDNNILTFASSGPTKTYFTPFYHQYVTLGHKYFISANILSNSNNTQFQFGTLNSNIRISNITKGLYENIIQCNYEINSSIGFATFSIGSNVGSISGYYMLIDLTDWYGAGNEPTTVEEFKATFPNKYYPYSKKTLLNKYMINGLVSN